jgi:hypothetical protein
MPSLSSSSFGPWLVTVPLAKVPVIHDEKPAGAPTVRVPLPEKLAVVIVAPAGTLLAL